MNRKKYINGVLRSLTIFTFIFSAFLFAVSASSCKEKKQTIRKNTGILILKTNPAGASLSIAGRVQKSKTPAKFTISPGISIVKFTYPGYHTEWRKVKVETNKTCELNVDLVPLTASLLVAAKADGKFGVRVSYNNKDMGETPLVLRDLPLGKGEIVLSKKGYSAQRVGFEVINSLPPPTISTELRSNRGAVKIQSQPDNAEVYLNEKHIGNTPLLENLEEGRYTLRLKKTGYLPYTRSFEIQRNKTLDLKRIKLRPQPSHLTVDSIPSGAKIYINEKVRGMTPGTPMKLSPGKYTVKVEKEGFDFAEEEIILSGGENKKITLKLDTVMGGLDIVTRPAGVSVYVDGKFICRSQPDTSNPKYSKVIKLSNMRQGEHIVKISHKRAKRPAGGSLTKVVTVKKGKTTRVDQIELWVPDIKLILEDGEIVEGRFINKRDNGDIFCESSPGIRYTYKKERISRIEKLPLEDN